MPSISYKINFHLNEKQLKVAKANAKASGTSIGLLSKRLLLEATFCKKCGEQIEECECE